MLLVSTHTKLFNWSLYTKDYLDACKEFVVKPMVESHKYTSETIERPPGEFVHLGEEPEWMKRWPGLGFIPSSYWFTHYVSISDKDEWSAPFRVLIELLGKVIGAEPTSIHAHLKSLFETQIAYLRITKAEDSP